MRTSHALGAILLSLAATSPLTAQAFSLATTMAGGNGGGAGWTNQMDWTVTNPINVISLDLNLSSPAGTAGTIDIYMTAAGGTYVGNELVPGVWTLVAGAVPVTSNGAGVAAVATLAAPMIVSAGTYGVAILYNSVSMSYTNGNGANQTYSDANLKLDLGSSTTGLFTGSIFNPRVWNGAVNYDPASGLLAAFTGAPRQGVSPLPVQFTDQSFSASGTVTSWGWDFDDNGTIDSNVQSPQFTYFGGVWNVSLSVTDGVNPPSKETKTAYILVDIVVAEFSAVPLDGPSPLTVAFTDLSTGPVIVWAWDFDNDGNVDSVVQNPSFIYTTPGKWTVKLGVANATSNSTTTKTDYIETDKIVASFTVSNNAPALGGSVAFTDTSTGPVTGWSWDLDGDGTPDAATQNASFTYNSVGIFNAQLTITNGFAFDSATETIEVGTIPVGPFVRTFSGGIARGFWFQTPVAFSIVGAKVFNETGNANQNVEIMSMGAAPPAFPGTATGGQLFYASMVPAGQVIPMIASFAPGDFVGVLGATGDTTQLQNSYGGANVASSVLGQAVTLTRLLTQFNIATAGGNPYSQEATGPIARTRLLITDAAGVDYGDASDNGLGNGAPTQTTTSLPVLGGVGTIDVTNMDAGSINGAMLIGFGRTPLPTPLGTINVANVVMDAPVTGLVGSGTFSFNVMIPNTPSILGGPTDFQTVILNPSAPNFFGMTNGTEWYIGN